MVKMFQGSARIRAQVSLLLGAGTWLVELDHSDILEASMAV